MRSYYLWRISRNKLLRYIEYVGDYADYFNLYIVCYRNH